MSTLTTHTRLLGAVYVGGTTTFTVWAPDHQQVELVVERTPDRSALGFRPLARDERGYWSGAFDDLPPGSLYRYRLDSSDGHVFPDPASRWQPQGVHGPSAVVDPAAFVWTHETWEAPPLERLVIYELHVGTFAPGGTFDAVAEQLGYLAQLGITAIELMPVADFPGRHNWGYDGALLFAPAHTYGPPDALRALVDAAHRHGLAVILDVVYNHFGPDGAYAAAFSSSYFSDRHPSPWGRGMNFDGPRSAEVRRFFVENALQWVLDFHVDGLRLDATHAIADDSRPHFLAELTSVVRAAAGRDVLLIAEDERNIARMKMPADAGGYGLDAVWADDFHHQVRVHVAGDRDGYYVAYSGSAPDLATTIRQGWFYTGQVSPHTGQPRGSDPSALQPPQFVYCLQNHDQVGNRADGSRLHHRIEPAVYRAVTTLLLSLPHTPLLFMGQEWAAGTPFQFFTDHNENLGRLVTAGRRAEFASFAGFGLETVPDPQQPETFERSRLEWSELNDPDHAGVLRLYRRLLALRRSHPAMQASDRGSFDVEAEDAHTLLIRRWSADRAHALFVAVRLSGTGTTTVQLPERCGDTLLTTEDQDIARAPQPVRVNREASRIEFDRPGAIVLSASRAT
jgi:maltooligosyltrehalose trehalohydrolase